MVGTALEALEADIANVGWVWVHLGSALARASCSLERGCVCHLHAASIHPPRGLSQTCVRVAPQLRAAGERDVDDIRTLMEEVDMRISETKKTTYEFKRDIILGGDDGHSGNTSADKVLR